jgi:hypothetical protein
MVNPLVTATYLAAFYGLGALGFVAVTALPVRLWTHLQRNIWAVHATVQKRVTYLLLALIGAGAIAFAGSNLITVGQCLLGFHCSVKSAGGWMALGNVGFWYLVYELLAFAIVRVGLRKPGDAT